MYYSSSCTKDSLHDDDQNVTIAKCTVQGNLEAKHT